MRSRLPLGHYKAATRLELLESRLLLATDLRFAVVGDYSVGQPAADVANLIKSWNPAFVVTTGDNNYPNGAASTIDANVGQYYHSFISPYTGTYGAGSADGVNHFFPVLGNHDWLTAGATPYLNYFTLPNNERYYDVTIGNVEIFAIDSESPEPDGVAPGSVQYNWFKSEAAKSTAQFKLFVYHEAAYGSGGSVADNTTMQQWPFAAWGAAAVLAGHQHDYERLNINGLPMFVNGLGGESLDPFGTTDPNSQVRYNADYGAMLVDATSTSINFQFITRTGLVIDNYTINAATGTPAAPSGLALRPQSFSQITLNWADNSGNETGFQIQRSTDGTNFSVVGSVGANVTTYTDTGLASATTYTYRVVALGSAGNSAPSAMVAAATFDPAVTTFASDMPFVSATNGWGPVERDMSNGSTAAGDGHTITLHGVQYTKGIGAHAASSIVINLGGAYASFVSDLGVDDEEIGKGVGSVDFQVLGDGKLLYDSGVLTSNSATAHANVNVTGVQQVTLKVTDGGNGIDYDHADWAGARFVRSAPSLIPAAPSNLTASANTTQVTLGWFDNSSNETGFSIERSVNGGQFSVLQSVGANVIGYVDSAVSAGNTYTYRVSAFNGSGTSSPSNTASATLQAAGTSVYVSDLPFATTPVNGWGPVERDTSNGSLNAGDGNTITLNGVKYAKGLGVHANSDVRFNLNGQYSTFSSDIGVDDEVGSKGSVDFQVWADGVLLYDSGIMTGASATKHVSVNVAGRQQLQLVVTNGGGSGIDYDHADWAGAKLTV